MGSGHYDPGRNESVAGQDESAKKGDESVVGAGMNQPQAKLSQQLAGMSWP